MASKISLCAASTRRWAGKRLLSTISTTSLWGSVLKKRFRREGRSTLVRRSKAGPTGRGRRTSTMSSSPSAPEVCRLSDRDGSLSTSPSTLGTLPAWLRSSESMERAGSWFTTSSRSSDSAVYPLSSDSSPLSSPSSSSLSLSASSSSSSTRSFGRCPPTITMLPSSSQAACPPRAMGLRPTKSGCVQVSVSKENMKHSSLG
mmetsp:Transcript_21716/g.38717  ORF Transcript_21716/g.38717 Transcript_21716/m.38717 type:complete len:202 (+) Transcript_21716:472-1077(+)